MRSRTIAVRDTASENMLRFTTALANTTSELPSLANDPSFAVGPPTAHANHELSQTSELFICRTGFKAWVTAIP